MPSTNPPLLTPHSWLITGGCGFIGRNLISNLVAEGNHVIRIIDNLKVGTIEDLKKVCNFEEIDPSQIRTNNFSRPTPSFSLNTMQLVVGDIIDADLAIAASAGFDVIVHLGANTGVAPSVENPRMDFETNVIGTFNYLEAARQCGVSRFVFASSGAPAGELLPPIHEELPPHPVSPYGASKLAGEGYCSAYYRTFGVEAVCLRFGNVYGPLSGKKDSVVAKFIKRAMTGEFLEIYGDGNQTRDFIYVIDIVNAIRAAARKPGIGGETFQIATSKETTVREMVEQLLPILVRHGYDNTRLVHGEKRIGDIMRNFSDTTKARNVLGWRCTHALEDGLKKTVQWFVDQSPYCCVADAQYKKSRHFIAHTVNHDTNNTR